jgi:hypothetical protein
MEKKEALKRAAANLRNAQAELENNNPIGKEEALDRFEFWKAVVESLESSIMHEKMAEAIDSIVEACLEQKKNGGGTA